MAALETEIIFDPVLGAIAKKKVVKESEDLGEKSGRRFSRGFGKSANRFIGNSFKNVLAGVTADFVKTGALIATGLFGGFTAAAVRESSKVEASLTGLRSVASSFGNDADQVTQAAISLAQDGLVPLENVTGSLKNLLINFNGDLDKSVAIFKVFRDSASFGRQGALSLGEAIEGASEGLKNDLSIKTDNAGLTKNLSIINKEYAASIGTTVGKLTEAQKAQAEYVGFLKEGVRFQGDFNRLQGTFSGAVSAASTSFKFLLAAFGGLITSSPVVLTLIGEVTKSIQGLTAEILKSGSGQAVKDAILGVIRFGRAVNDFVVRPLALLGQIAAASFRVLASGLSTAIAGLGKLGLIIADVLNAVGIDNKITQTIQDIGNSLDEVAVENAKKAKEALAAILEPNEFANRSAEFLAVLEQTIQNADPKLKGFAKAIADAFKNTNKEVKKSVKDVNSAIDGALGQALGNTIARLGERLGAGKSVFKDFGKFVLTTLGDLSIQVGQAAIAFGIATSAIKNLSPLVAIAAGATLIGIGGILKGLGGGVSGSGVSYGESSTAGSGAATPAALASAPEDQALDDQEPTQSVQLVVQGDILNADTGELGRKLVSILNDNFEREGSVVTGASFA